MPNDGICPWCGERHSATAKFCPKTAKKIERIEADLPNVGPVTEMSDKSASVGESARRIAGSKKPITIAGVALVLIALTVGVAWYFVGGNEGKGDSGANANHAASTTDSPIVAADTAGVDITRATAEIDSVIGSLNAALSMSFADNYSTYPVMEHRDIARAIVPKYMAGPPLSPWGEPYTYSSGDGRVYVIYTKIYGPSKTEPRYRCYDSRLGTIVTMAERPSTPVAQDPPESEEADVSEEPQGQPPVRDLPPSRQEEKPPSQSSGGQPSNPSTNQSNNEERTTAPVRRPTPGEVFDAFGKMVNEMERNR